MTRFPRLRVLGLAALAVAVLAMAANAAQPPGGGRGGQRGGFRGGPGGGRGPGGMMGGGGPGGGVANLLRNPQIQEELKLSDEQKEQLREVAEAAFEGMRDFLPNREEVQDLSEEERGAKMREAMEKLNKEREKRAPETEKKIAGILKKEQFKRLKQIQLQQMRVDALKTPDVVQALGLSEDQQKEIKEVLDARDKKRQALGEEMRGLYEGYRDMSDEEREKLRSKGEEFREKGQAIASEAQKAAMGKLTDDQKAKLPGLMGEPFELRRPEFGQGRPGQGRAGEGRRGEGERGEGGEGQRRRRPRPSST